LKPQYIFGAVITICLLMAALLPLVGRADLSAQAQPLPDSNLTTAPQALPGFLASPTTAPLPVVATDQVEPETVQETVVEEQPTPEQQPVVENSDQEVQVSEAQPEPPPVEQAISSSDTDLQQFAAGLVNGQAGVVTGVYVPGLFAMPVISQPGGDESYVSADDNILTQYAKPTEYGVIALLAHNYLNSGRSFFDLKPDQEIVIVYGDGSASRYRVTKVSFYQAMDSHNIRSDFRDLNGPGGEVITYDQLFSRIYTNRNQVVFQTCIEANGDLSWGRLFVTADPAG
jgi:hypothetical protein